METTSKSPALRPPFTAETAALKVQAAEDAWNTRDPERVALAYSVDSEWRNRAEFIRGRNEIKAFLSAQMGERTGLQAEENPVGVRRQPHRSELRI